MPAFNEAQVIASVVRSLVNEGYKVIVVDDCSTDNTYQEALSAGAHTLRHLTNLGQGAALQTAIDYAIGFNPDYIVTFDADGQHQVSDILKLLSLLKEGDFDVVLGSRFLKDASAENIPYTRRLILKLAVFYTRLTTGLDLTDTHNGLRAFKARALKKLRITQNRMAHAGQILSLIAQSKLSYSEAAVGIIYTNYSLQKGQRMSNSLNILWESFTGLLRR